MKTEPSSNGEITRRPSILSANLLFLAGMVLVLFIAGPLQQRHFGLGLLATELLLGALALLWTRLARLPWRETLRLRPAPARSLALAFLMGLGIWLLDSWLGALSSFVLGYDVPTRPGFYPQSAAAALLLFVGMALGAPLCEELFFRGYMQRAYGRLRPLPAILIVAVLFALFHLSLLGFPPLLPIALALGYVAWRSGSLWPGVVLHAANNMMAVAILTLIGLRPDLLDALNSSPLAPGGLPAAIGGLALVAVSGWLFHRGAGVAQPAPQAAPPATAARRILAALPLLLALLVYGGVAALEVVMGHFPELLAVQPLDLERLPWTGEVSWQYRIQHPGAETVGDAACALTPAAEGATLACALQHEPFEVRQGNSVWAGGDLERRFKVVYGVDDCRLQQIDETQAYGEAGYHVSARPQGEALLLEVEGENVGQSAEQIPPTALVDGLWPWQLPAMPFAAGVSYQATLVFPQRYDAALERSVLTVTDTAVVVRGVEPLSVPAGEFIAWRVTVDDETAWYDVDPPHTLLQYDSGPIIWQFERETN